MTGLPSLDDFLSTTRRHGFCAVCLAPAEAKKKVREKYDAEVRAWAGFTRYLKACGVENVTPAKLQRHLEQGHSDE